MTDLPDPPVPPDLDLRDFRFMPVDVRRLLTSETWMTGTGDQKAAAMSLWLESWHQVPCGSLPDNDRMLAHLSQAGTRWQHIRAFVLRGWVKCSDGRLYHHVVTEKAAEARTRKEAYRQRAAAARAAKEAKRPPIDLFGSAPAALPATLLRQTCDIDESMSQRRTRNDPAFEPNRVSVTEPVTGLIRHDNDRERSKNTTLGASASRAHTREAPPEISIQNLGSSSFVVVASYTAAELETLQTEFSAIDVAATVPELLAWAVGKGIHELEQKSAVYGALAQRQAKANLAARARAPPAQIAVSDALVASLQRRRL